MATIEHKYELGQQVWTLDDHKLQSFVITDIHIRKAVLDSVRVQGDTEKFAANSIVCIDYRGHTTDWVSEKDIFPTKESLVQSLLDELKIKK